MKITKINDFNPYPTNERNGTYGGNAGEKEGITIDSEYWMVKYPKSTKGMRGKLTSYTTAPLSEYIGSNIYQILGINAHDTMLGVRNNKLVVACKDFCKIEGSLREIRTVKNVYNQELAEKLDTTLSSTSSSHLIDINDMVTHLNYNPVLKQVPDTQDRFWEQIIVDSLINNNDRNNGNWGVLYENGTYRLAPVFDNGAAFSNKLPDEQLNIYLQHPERLQQSLDTSRTIYSKDGKEIYTKDIVNLEYEGFQKAVIKLVPIIDSKMSEINEFINNIPEQYQNITVCSSVRKQFYNQSMQMRFEQFLKPAYEKALAQSKNNVKSVISNVNYCGASNPIERSASLGAIVSDCNTTDIANKLSESSKPKTRYDT